jgi:two-component system invasion response regulator UvrY
VTEPLRILVVDDHPIVRQGLKQTLADAADVGEIGEAANGQQALELVRQREWDAVVLDIGLPGRGGIEIRALRAGAGGYLTKEAATERLVEAVRKITTGGRFISADLAERLAMELTLTDAGPPHASLSDREFEVLCLIGSGLSVGDIADRMSLSVKTVSTYRARILEKMRMKNNAELMQYVLTNRLIDCPPAQ